MRVAPTDVLGVTAAMRYLAARGYKRTEGAIRAMIERGELPARRRGKRGWEIRVMDLDRIVLEVAAVQGDPKARVTLAAQGLRDAFIAAHSLPPGEAIEVAKTIGHELLLMLLGSEADPELAMPILRKLNEVAQLAPRDVQQATVEAMRAAGRGAISPDIAADLSKAKKPKGKRRG